MIDRGSIGRLYYEDIDMKQANVAPITNLKGREFCACSKEAPIPGCLLKPHKSYSQA